MSEAKKFVPMTIMMFLVLLNFSTLRSLKDSLIVPNMGAEVISFVKFGCVLPSAIIFTVLYMKLANILDGEKLFYAVTLFFISFFAIFAFIIYPNRDFIHPSPQMIANLAESFVYVKWPIYLLGKWSFALFYIFAELWGAVMINLMFWQFANKITKTEEATRFYASFGLVGNLGLIISGNLVMIFSKLEKDSLFVYSMVTLIASSLLLMAIYRWMHLYVLTDPKHYSPKKGGLKKKLKLSLWKSIKMAFSSRYLGYIVLIVICYGMTINLIEGPWKAKVRELYPDQNGYANFMGQFVQWTGIVTIFFMILGGNILKNVRWFTSAIMTPIMILLTGGGFFMFVIFEKSILYFTEDWIKITPVALAVLLGVLQNILSKATKYTMFDSTKEMAFIPLDDEFRTKGKAVVDVVGGRLAKSGGAAIQLSLFTLFPLATFASTSIIYILSAVFLFFMVTWIFAVSRLSEEYDKLVNKS